MNRRIVTGRGHILRTCVAIGAAMAAVFAAPRIEARPAHDSSKSAKVQQLLEQANSEYQNHKYEEAAKSFDKASDAAHGQCSECWRGLAQSNVKLHKGDEALKAASKAVKTATNDSELLNAHLVCGDVLLDAAGMEPRLDKDAAAKAESEFKAALALQPRIAGTHLRLAMAYFKESRDSEGKAELDEYLRIEPAGAYAAFAKALGANPRRGRARFAPDFKVTTADGKTLSLQSFHGRYLVLDFWATWCPPCRASVGELRELRKKYPVDRLAILSVSHDKDEKKWREFTQEHRMDWPQYLDADHKIGDLFGVNAIPDYVVIDPEGVIAESIVAMNPQETIVHRLRSVLEAIAPEKNGKKQPGC